MQIHLTIPTPREFRNSVLASQYPHGAAVVLNCNVCGGTFRLCFLVAAGLQIKAPHITEKVDGDRVLFCPRDFDAPLGHFNDQLAAGAGSESSMNSASQFRELLNEQLRPSSAALQRVGQPYSVQTDTHRTG